MAKPYYQTYDEAREADEQIGHVKPSSYTGQRIAKKTVSVNPETPVTAVDITQANAMKPDEK